MRGWEWEWNCEWDACRCTGASETPIVAVTANAMEEQVLECSAAGMDEVLTKPFKLGQLIDILRRHLPHLKEQKFKT